MGVLSERIFFLAAFIIIPPLILAILMITVFTDLMSEYILALVMLGSGGVILPFIGGVISSFGIKNGGERMIVGLCGGVLGSICIIIFVILILQDSGEEISDLMLGFFFITVICSTIGAEISPRF